MWWMMGSDPVQAGACEHLSCSSFPGMLSGERVVLMGSTADLLPGLDMTPELLRVLTRIVGLVSSPKESWSEEDEAFFRKLRERVQEARNGGG